MSTRPQTAFVLSGGAALGAIQVGMLRALYEHGIEPDVIVGSSVGAVNGAFIASRPFTPATADELAEVWHQVGRGQVFPLNPVVGFLGFFGARRHLVPARGLRDLLVEHLEFDRLEQARVPFHVITTDVLNGSEVRLSLGPALDAVMASTAIPGIFPPVDWGHRHLMDGGIANHAPLSDALELGAERVDRAELIVLPPPCQAGASPIDLSRSNELIRHGLKESRRYLDGQETGRSEDPGFGLDPVASTPVFSKHELHRERLASSSRPTWGFARSRQTSSLNGTCRQDSAPRPPQASPAAWRRSGSCDSNHN